MIEHEEWKVEKQGYKDKIQILRETRNNLENVNQGLEMELNRH